LISAALAIPAEKVKCILNGDSICTYVIPSQLENPMSVNLLKKLPGKPKDPSGVNPSLKRLYTILIPKLLM
jgi:hypothetical protein